MRATVILNIKSWLSKIHPPLPRSARESQQLLNVLTASFQRQLDEAHPPLERRGHHPSNISSSKTNSRSASRATGIDSLTTIPLSDNETSTSTWVSLSHAIHRGAGDLDTIIRLSASVPPTQTKDPNHHPSFLVENILSGWFRNASLQTRTAVLRDQRILKAIRGLLPGMQYQKVLWDELDRYIIESPAAVTYDEAKAISTCATFNLISTPDLSMHESANRFQRTLGIFQQRAFQEQTSGETASRSKTGLHPLGKPARWLVFFILFHPNSHGLSAEHFDTLLGISNVWDNPLLLRKEMLYAFHPIRQDPSGVIRALSDPEFRTVHSFRLKTMPPNKRDPTTPLVSLSQMLEEKGRYHDAEIIRSFVQAHLTGEDVSILPSRPQAERSDGTYHLVAT